MSYYWNLLSGPNGRLGYTADDPDRNDANVDYKISLSAKPKKNIVSIHLIEEEEQL